MAWVRVGAWQLGVGVSSQEASAAIQMRTDKIMTQERGKWEGKGGHGLSRWEWPSERANMNDSEVK